MWWLLYFSTIVALLLTAAVALSAVEHLYEKSLEGFRLVKFVKDQWFSLAQSLENALCHAAEDLAQNAVDSFNISRYYDLGLLFDMVLTEIREKTLLKKINGSRALEGDAFKWQIRFLRYNKTGVVDWLRPSELITAASIISSLDLDLNLDVENTIRSKMSRGTSLRGVIYGHLTGNMTYSGYLDAHYTLRDKAPLKCREGSLQIRFSARHYAMLYINSTAESVYIYVEVFIDN